MAWVHDFAVTEGTVAATATGDCDMPAHDADDILIVFGGKDGTGALTMVGGLGYTALSSGAGGAQWVGAWYKRATTSSELPPSFTLASDEYNVIVVTVRGAHTSTNPTSAITTDDNTMNDGGYLINQTLDSEVNGLMLFGACSDTGIGIEPMPGFGQILYAGDVSTAGVGVWWQYFKSVQDTSAYRCFGTVADNTRAVKVLIPDDGNNTYEPGRIDQTSTHHKLYAGPWGGTALVAPDTTWSVPSPAANSIDMLGNDWDKAWTFDGTSTYTDVTQALNDDGYRIMGRNVLTGTSSTDASSYAMATTIYRTGRLYLLSIENSKATTADAVSSITGGGPTFTSRATTNFNASSVNRVSVWSAVPTTDFTGALTIDFAGVTQTGCVWSLNEFTFVDTTTNDGIVQSVTNTGSSGTALATLSAYTSYANAPFGAFGVGAANAGTAGSGFLELSDTTAATPAQALHTGYKNTEDTTVDETFTSAQWGACALELKASAAHVSITNATGAIIYFGSLTTFSSLCIEVGIAGGGGSPTGVWEYWNGSTWSTLTVKEWPNISGWTSLWNTRGQGHITFTPPSTWSTTTVNGEGTSYYYIRRRVTATWTTNAPSLNQSLKDGRSLAYAAPTGLADSGLNPYHLSYRAAPVAGTANSYLQHTGGEFIANPYSNDANRVFGIPDFSSSYLLTSFLLAAPRDLIDLGFYDLHKGAAITLMNPKVAPRNILASSSTTDSSTFTTAQVTMVAGRLYLISVENSHGTSATAVSSVTATGGGAPTFTSRSSTQFNSNLNRVSIWSCVPSSDYTGTLDIDFGGTTQTGAIWSLNEINNVDTTTNHGIVQQASSTGNSAFPATSLAAYSSEYNASFGTIGVGAANAGTALSFYTELSDTTTTSPNQAMQTVFQGSAIDRTPGNTITSAEWGCCGLEIKSQNSTDNSRATWICGAKDASDQNSAKRKIIGIQPSQSQDTTWARHGTLKTQAVDTFIGSSSAPYGATSCAWSLLLTAGNHILSGGTSTTPLTFQQAATALVNGANLFPVWDVSGDVAEVWHPTQFGGGDDVHLNFSLKTFQFPTRASASAKTSQWHVDDDMLGFDFNGQTGDTLKFTSCLFTGGTPYYWRFNASAASGATWDFSGSSIVGATVTLRAVYTFTNLTFNNCSEIVLNGADMTDSTIRDTRATTSQGALAITSPSEGDGLTNLTFINNHDGDIGHSIRITATGTYNFSGHSFSGGGVAPRSFNTGTGVNSGTDIVTTDAVHGYADGDAIYYQDQGGAVTMGLTDGTLYYVNAQSTTTLSFHTTKADAIADTNKVNLTSSGTETHYIYSAKADVYNDSGGAVTINISNGGDVPTIRNSNAATTTVNSTVTLTVTVKNSTGNPIENAQVWVQKESDDSDPGHPGNPFTLTTGNNQGDAQISVNQTPPNDLPASGWIRLSSGSSEQTYRYASRSSTTFTLNAEITGNDNGTGTTTTLNETNIGSKNILEGDTIRNTTANPDQWATVLSVTTNSITTTPLSDGGTWASSSYSVHRLASNYTTSDTATVPLVNESTNISGTATEQYNYTADKDILVRIRLASGSTDYLPYSTAGTVTSTGYSLQATLQTDTIKS